MELVTAVAADVVTVGGPPSVVNESTAPNAVPMLFDTMAQ